MDSGKISHPVHHPETALSHAVARVPRAHPDDCVEDVLPRLVGQGYDYAGSVFLLDESQRLVGTVPMARLLAGDGRTRLGDLAQIPLTAVSTRMDQEQVASQAITHGVTAMPVVDDDGRLVGVVPPDVLMEVLRREHVEDLHRLAGIRRETVHARVAMEAPPMRRVRDRLPWLLGGLVGSMLATLVVARFEQALQAKVMLTFFVPGIVYLADAIGTQTEAIAVRGLSLSNVPIARLVGGEIRTGLLIGLVLGGLVFPAVWWVFGDPAVALAVALALVIASTVATTIGLLFPWALSRMGKDPAFGSGPIATILQDVLSLVIYFWIVTVVVL